MTKMMCYEHGPLSLHKYKTDKTNDVKISSQCLLLSVLRRMVLQAQLFYLLFGWVANADMFSLGGFFE